ncbi:unnamed protein product [Rotaria socialis]|uniref:Uncharacterized protein n=1 Tax=Rotaria socialis TaxID=392032 RepID=A0A821EQL6_9BILA|nr:unnamed protein product [Rotaria socialis]
MSTIESNPKNQPVLSISTSLQPVTPSPTPPPPLIIPNASTITPTTSLPSSPALFHDDKPIEKLYKKEKQILFEFEQIVKGS